MKILETLLIVNEHSSIFDFNPFESLDSPDYLHQHDVLKIHSDYATG